MSSGQYAATVDAEVFCGQPDDDTGIECSFYERYQPVHADYETHQTTWECPQCGFEHVSNTDWLEEL